MRRSFSLSVVSVAFSAEGVLALADVFVGAIVDGLCFFQDRFNGREVFGAILVTHGACILRGSDLRVLSANTPLGNTFVCEANNSELASEATGPEHTNPVAAVAVLCDR
jgi:hypothetical protein